MSRKKMAILVFSNKNPNKTWLKEQKEGFDVIEYLRLPKIDYMAGIDDIYYGAAKDIVNKIKEFSLKYPLKEDYLTRYTIENADPTLVRLIYARLEDELDYYKFIFPVIKKEIQKEKLPDGTEVKRVIKKFVRWR